MDMIATIIHSDSSGLLVRDLNTNEMVKVLAPNVYNFPPNYCIRITYDGKKTNSIPPQIIAASIFEIECPD